MSVSRQRDAETTITHHAHAHARHAHPAAAQRASMDSMRSISSSSVSSGSSEYVMSDAIARYLREREASM